MENIQNIGMVPSIAVTIEANRRAPFSPDQDVVQQHSVTRDIPINEHMFMHIEMARLGIVDALRSSRKEGGSRIFPSGSWILIPPAQHPYLIDERHRLQALARQPESDEEREILIAAVAEAQWRHHEL